MTHFLERVEDLLPVKERVAKSLQIGANLPSQVFSSDYKAFLFADYAHLQSAKALVRLQSTFPADLIFLDPNFEKQQNSDEAFLRVIRLSPVATEDQIAAILFQSPNANPADAFNVACHKCLLTPVNDQWVIYGDRNWDIAIIGFRDSTAISSFRERASSWNILENVDMAVDLMLGLSSRSDKDVIRAAMIAHYRS